MRNRFLVFSFLFISFAALADEPLQKAYDLLNQGHFEEAAQEAAKFSSGPLANDAKIVTARSKFGQGDTQGALTLLDTAKFPADWAGAVHYWRGVAHYEAGEADLAQADFKKAHENTGDQHWAHGESQGWLDRMQRESRLFRLQANLSYAYDGNVAQSGGMGSGPSGSSGTGGGGGSGQGGQNGGSFAQPTAVSVPDTGPVVDLTLSLRPFHTTKGSYLEASVGTYQSYYFLNPSYDFESFIAKVSGEWAVSNHFRLSAGIAYMDTRYYFSYYQDYLTPSLGASWDFARNFTVSLRSSLQINMLTRPGFAVFPAATVEWNGWLDIWAGFNFGYAKGIAATVSSTPPQTVLSGTLFSNYVSYGPFLGASRSLFWGLDLAVNGSLSFISYPLDNVPTLGPTSGRFDTIWSGSVTLSRYFLNGHLKVGAMGQYTYDNSTGYSGVPTSSGLPINTYSRPYVALLTSIYL